LAHSVKTIKFMQLCCTRYLAGDPLLSNDLRIGLCSHGLPKWILGGNSPFREGFLKRDPQTVRAVLTVLNVTRLFNGNGEFDSTSVESPSLSSIELEDDIISELRASQWGKALKRSY